MIKGGRTHLLLLALVVLTYVGIGALYAVYTPPWQAPDEPAHYNYIRALAETGRFPILQMGDYPHEYLEEIKARRFPPDLSIDPIRYESHQPPLYYMLATPLFWLTGGALLPLRLLSVGLGAILLLVAYGMVRTVLPSQPALAIAATAVVAFVPMHVAMTAGVENDTLAELLLSLVAWLALRHLVGQEESGAVLGRRLAQMGVLLGLVLLTKTTAYGAVVLALVAVVWRWVADRGALRSPWRTLGWRLLAVYGPALLLALPWYARNIAVYGWPDAIGLRWHNAVVVGQPRTVEWIAQYGWGSFLQRFAEFTFKSFWGLFGWMGVFLDQRIYQALGLFTVVATLGLLVLVVRWTSMGVAWRRERREIDRTVASARPLSGTSRQLALLAVWIGWTILQYLGYNLTFVQHQGRYLFPALIPMGLALTLGWQEVLRPTVSRWLGTLLALIALVLAIAVLVMDEGPVWPLALCAAGACGLLLRPLLPRWLDGLLLMAPSIGLALLCLVSLFAFIVPGLS